MVKLAKMLKHKEEFSKVLSNYHINPEAKKTLAASHLVLLTGPTGCGRNTLINSLLKTGDYRYLVSHTTRKQRINNGRLEEDGVAYNFRSEEKVLSMLQKGQFIEAAIIHDQQVSGISVIELEKAAKAKKIGITEVTVKGVESYMSLKPDTVAIYVLLPSFEEWMKRLHKRGELPKEELKRRLASALDELQDATDKDHYFYVINDNFDQALKDIDRIAKQKTQNESDKFKAKELAKKLHKDVEKYLDTLLA